MIVYHGSTMEIKKPNVSFSKKYLDFGNGFYLTTYKHQAENWALRKSSRLRKEPIVTVYELSDIDNYKTLEFESEDESWIEFVCACRKGDTRYRQYDIIIGGVADDKVFQAVDMYADGIWDIERTLKELKYYKINNQICIINQEILDKHLVFKESYKVGESNG